MSGCIDNPEEKDMEQVVNWDIVFKRVEENRIKNQNREPEKLILSNRQKEDLIKLSEENITTDRFTDKFLKIIGKKFKHLLTDPEWRLYTTMWDEMYSGKDNDRN